jgi:hypothetical protein
VCGLFLLIVGWQIVGPVPTGLPDNGDFAKVLAALNISIAPGAEKTFPERYFAPQCLINEKYHWVAELPSSEFWIAKAAKRYALWFLPAGHFDLRIMGVLHSLLLALALWLLLRAYRPERLWIEAFAGAFLLFLFTDVEYVQFLSTAYADTAAIVFFCIFVGVALNLWRRLQDASFFWVLALAASGCLFLTSKLQHQFAVFPVCALALVFAYRTRSPRRRLYYIVPIAAFLVATFLMISNTRDDYRADPVYAMIFTRLAPYSKEPGKVLNEFGVPASYSKYIGTLPFQNGYLLNDMSEREFFVNQVTLSKIAGYYARHPDVAIHFLISDLKEFAPDLTLNGWPGIHRYQLSDYQQHRTNSLFTWWSSLRRALQSRFWMFIPGLYAFAAAICIVSVLRPAFLLSVQSWPIVALLVVVGTSTFVIASLNDCIETARHIIVFQVATDLMLFLLVLEWVLHYVASRALRRTAVSAGSEVSTAHFTPAQVIRHI